MLHPLPGQTFLGFGWEDGIHKKAGRASQIAEMARRAAPQHRGRIVGRIGAGEFLGCESVRVERDGDMGEVAAGRLALPCICL